MPRRDLIKILATGKSDFSYNRTKILFAGFHAHEKLELSTFPIISRSSFDKKAFQTAAAKNDFVFIPAFRHRDVSYIKKLTNKPIIFDPLISKYLTKKDYGQTWKAPMKFFLDKIPFKKADLLLADTAAHKDYYNKVFGIPIDKILVLPIGVDSAVFYPKQKQEDDYFCVGFYGNFNPLQAVDKIVKAAHILSSEKDIRFKIVGGGFDFNKVQQLVEKLKIQNVIFTGKVPYENLNDEINSFDICLGVFGDSEKTDLVVPNKIFHYAACKKAIITKKNKAMEEFFKDGFHLCLIDNNPEQIAQSILELKNNASQKTLLEDEIYRTVLANYDKEYLSAILYNRLKDFK